MSDLALDLRYAIRGIVGSPGYALTSALVLALAFAANAVAFSFVNTLFLRQPAVHEPERLVRIYTTYANGPRYFTLSYPDYRDADDLRQVFAGAVAEQPSPFSVTAEGAGERRWGYVVSANYFSVLGVRAAAGRVFTSADAGREGEIPIVLSDAYWRGRFGADPGIVGKTVVVNGRRTVIEGIAHAGFNGLNTGIRTDFWIPARPWHPPAGGIDPLDERGARGYFVAARLRPGATVEQAHAAMGVLGRRLRSGFPETNADISFTVLPEMEGGLHPMVRGAFVSFTGALWAVVTLVLGLACTNVTGLLLARTAMRRREIGVRVALGATRGRIVRQLLAEGALLWAAGGAGGMTIAVVVVRWLASIRLPTDRPVFVDVSADARVFAFAVLVTAATGIAFGLMPALTASKSDPIEALRAGERSRGARSRLRTTLVAGQVALSVALLVAATLCLRSLAHARQTDLGFEPRGVALASLDPSLQGYTHDRATRLLQDLRTRLLATPGIEAAGLAYRIPFEMNVIRTKVQPVGEAERALPSVDFAVVDGGYFATLRIPVRAGRVFSPYDTPQSPKVAVINETLARRLWTDGAAVGRRVRVGDVERMVVGIVKDGRYLTLGEERTPFVYVPFEQDGAAAATVLVRAADPPSALARIREHVRRIDATLPLFSARTMDEHLQIAAAPAGVTAVLFGTFGVLALLLASVGVYGLLAYSAAQRTREIGIRRALGARDRDVVALVMRQALTPVAGGVLAGSALGLIVSRTLGGIVYGVEATDPAAYLSAAAALLVTAVVACYVPARRAARVEPLDALRDD